MNANSELKERLKKAEAERQEEYKKINILVDKSSKDRLARMENFVRHIDMAYAMSGQTQNFETFNTFMRKFIKSEYELAEGKYLDMREYGDLTDDTNRYYKDYKNTCKDHITDRVGINIAGHRYLKEAEVKLVKYLDELKDNPQDYPYNEQTLKAFIKEASKSQQQLEVSDNRIAILNNQIYGIQELEKSLTAFNDAYDRELGDVRALTKKMKEENDVNWKLSFAKCMQGNIYNLKILANAISDNDAKKKAQNLAKELVDNVEKTMNEVNLAKELVDNVEKTMNEVRTIQEYRELERNRQSLVHLQKENTTLTQGFLGFFNKIFKSRDIERNRVAITELEYKIYDGTEINFRAKKEIAQQTHCGSKASKNNSYSRS